MARMKQHLYKPATEGVQWRERFRRKAREKTYSYFSAKENKLWRDLRTKLLQKSPRAQKSPGMLLPQGPFQRLAKVLSHSPGGSLRFQLPAYQALQEATEAHLVELFEDWRLCALHAKRVAVDSSDVHLVRCLRGQRA